MSDDFDGNVVLVTGAEVAAAAVWLCSAEANYIFGRMLVVHGGMTIGGFELS